MKLIIRSEIKSLLIAKIRSRIDELSFRQIPKIQKLADLPNVRKIKGYENYHRIRLGDYRIGVELRDEATVFYRVLHRKDIYKYFP